MTRWVVVNVDTGHTLVAELFDTYAEAAAVVARLNALAGCRRFAVDRVTV
jgi:hypothetical protein